MEYKEIYSSLKEEMQNIMSKLKERQKEVDKHLKEANDIELEMAKFFKKYSEIEYLWMVLFPNDHELIYRLKSRFPLIPTDNDEEINERNN